LGDGLTVAGDHNLFYVLDEELIVFPGVGNEMLGCLAIRGSDFITNGAG
jgi:hypothetical protein